MAEELKIPYEQFKSTVLEANNYIPKKENSSLEMYKLCVDHDEIEMLNFS